VEEESERQPGWQLLAGIIEYWADEGLRHIGRLRANGSTEPSAIPIGTIDEQHAAFVAQREPWRASQITLITNGTGAVIASWAGDATAVIDGVPAKQYVVASNESWGDLGLRVMLNPAALERLTPKPWPDSFRISGGLLKNDMQTAPDLYSASASRYEVKYDALLDVVTQWTAIIDESVASRLSLTHLSTLGAMPSE
jgi:hypothetical protein